MIIQREPDRQMGEAAQAKKRQGPAPYGQDRFKETHRGGIAMHERLTDQNTTPTLEAFVANMGNAKTLFDQLDAFLINDLSTEKQLKLDAHSRCWKISYHRKRKYIGDVLSEKDSFTVVTRLSQESLEKMKDSLLPYTNACIANRPYFHRGWIEYRVLAADHLNDAKVLLRVRADSPAK